jgi:hypothetical protein
MAEPKQVGILPAKREPELPRRFVARVINGGRPSTAYRPGR